jgi:putative membrane protein
VHWRIYERGMEFGWLFVIIFSVLVILGIIHLINLLSGGNGARRQRELPLDIIKRRYAEGEITKGEFEEMKHDILTRTGRDRSSLNQSRKRHRRDQQD